MMSWQPQGKQEASPLSSVYQSQGRILIGLVWSHVRVCLLLLEQNAID